MIGLGSTMSIYCIGGLAFKKKREGILEIPNKGFWRYVQYEYSFDV